MGSADDTADADALRAKAITAAEAVFANQLAEAWERNAAIQLSKTLQAQRRAGEAESGLAVLRAKASALIAAAEMVLANWSVESYGFDGDDPYMNELQRSAQAMRASLD